MAKTKTQLKRPNPRRTSEPVQIVAQDSGDVAAIYRLAQLSGLTDWERLFITQWTAHGLQTDGDRRCFDEMKRKYKSALDPQTTPKPKQKTRTR